MQGEQRYAPPDVWNRTFADYAKHDSDLNPSAYWAPAWIPYLKSRGVRKLLDLGCGTGSDSLEVAKLGIEVTGLDFSDVAIRRAREKARASALDVNFETGDMAQPLRFAPSTFDAVMSNVAFHSFDDATTRRILQEIRRVLRPDGYVLLHVNSTDDMPYRAQRYTRVREIESNYYLEAHGQTMHFFDEQYCKDLFADWELLQLKHVRLRGNSGDVFKCVWRIVASRQHSG